MSNLSPALACAPQAPCCRTREIAHRSAQRCSGRSAPSHSRQRRPRGRAKHTNREILRRGRDTLSNSFREAPCQGVAWAPSFTPSSSAPKGARGVWHGQKTSRHAAKRRPRLRAQQRLAEGWTSDSAHRRACAASQHRQLRASRLFPGPAMRPPMRGSPPQASPCIPSEASLR
jgi:hypothetical protein